jgi:hypothetical protein
MNAGQMPGAHLHVRNEPTAGAGQHEDEARALTRSLRRGGHAIGGQIIGRYRAAEAMRCGCCPCRIVAGEPVYEVLTAGALLEVCAECAGAR